MLMNLCTALVISAVFSLLPDVGAVSNAGGAVGGLLAGATLTPDSRVSSLFNAMKRLSMIGLVVFFIATIRLALD